MWLPGPGLLHLKVNWVFALVPSVGSLWTVPDSVCKPPLFISTRRKRQTYGDRRRPEDHVLRRDKETHNRLSPSGACP